MGVITLKDIDYGQIFGPFPTHLSGIDPAYLIGVLTSDKLARGTVVKVDTDESQEGRKSVDWLPRVSVARNEAEQNMEAYLKHGKVYYRTLRIIKAGEELLVWYSKDFTQVLGIPELQPGSQGDSGLYRCPHCGEMFEFPFSLRAHVRFQCSLATNDELTRVYTRETSNSTNSSVSVNSIISGRVSHDAPSDKSQYVLNYLTNNSAKFTQPSKRHLSDDGRDNLPVKKSLCDKQKSRKGALVSHSIDFLVGKRSGELCRESGFKYVSDSGSAFRKVEKTQRVDSGELFPSHISLPGFATTSKIASLPVAISSPETVTPACLSSNVSGLCSFSTPGTHIPLLASSSPTEQQPSTSSVSPDICSSIKPLVQPVLATTVVNADSSLSAAPRMTLFMSGIPLMPSTSPFGMPSLHPAPASAERGIHTHRSTYADQIPPGLLELCRATIPTIGPLTESFASNIKNNETLAKQALFADRHISSLAFLKSSNPMVEKLLQCTNPTLLSSPVNALNLSQNWCAKCNATFRMTSDLVYHMRSHHKRDLDPVKRTREEKLKCAICSEAFRERHHLTRHMSSHL